LRPVLFDLQQNRCAIAIGELPIQKHGIGLMVVKELDSLNAGSRLGDDPQGAVFVYQRTQALAEGQGILNEKQSNTALLVQACFKLNSRIRPGIAGGRIHLRLHSGSSSKSQPDAHFLKAV
jgi:hypothetical protein